MKMKIHTKGITGSRVIRPGEDAGGLFGVVLEIDGQVYDCVTSVSMESGDTFMTVTATFIPGSLEVVRHDEDSWDRMLKDADDRNKFSSVRGGGGQGIAIYVSPRPKDDS